MQTNIRGLVDRMELGPARGMMPLYEAISNAIDAIEDRNLQMSDGRVDISLLFLDDLAQ